MSLFQSLRWRILYGLCAALFFVMLVFSLNAPPAVIMNRVNMADVVFSAEHPVLLHAGQCVPVSWSVEYIEKVYFDDQPGVGAQTVTFCPKLANNPLPLLYIDFQGEFIQTYTLPLTILTQTVWFWTGVVIVVVGGLLTFIPFGRFLPERQRSQTRQPLSRRRFLWIGGTAIVAAVGFTWAVRQQPEATVLYDGWILKSSEVKSQ